MVFTSEQRAMRFPPWSILVFLRNTVQVDDVVIFMGYDGRSYVRRVEALGFESMSEDAAHAAVEGSVLDVLSCEIGSKSMRCGAFRGLSSGFAAEPPFCSSAASLGMSKGMVHTTEEGLVGLRPSIELNRS